MELKPKQAYRVPSQSIRSNRTFMELKHADKAEAEAEGTF